MLELDARAFLGAATQLARIHESLKSLNDIQEALPRMVADGLMSAIGSFRTESERVGAKLSIVSADRLVSALSVEPCAVTVNDLKRAVFDIESRFADHLHFIKLFAIPDDRLILFGGAESLLGDLTIKQFPAARFDCEEATKCLVLGRATACVFHTMRMLEVALRALSKRLDILEPIKAAEKNWGVMLSRIKCSIDSLYPASKRLAGDEGSFFESVYVSLDAIKHPWRNGTMHVDAKYTESEAQHILQCSAVLVQTMARGFNEAGISTFTRSIRLQEN